MGGSASSTLIQRGSMTGSRGLVVIQELRITTNINTKVNTNNSFFEGIVLKCYFLSRMNDASFKEDSSARLVRTYATKL